MTGPFFRVVNLVLAVLLAAALVVVGVLVPVEVALYFAGRESWVLPWRDWASSLSDLQLSASDVLLTCVVLAVVGLVLLLLETGRRTKKHLPAEPVGDARAVVVTKGLHSAAEAAAQSVDGVASAKARGRGKKLDVTADAQVRQTEGMAPRVRQAVEERIEALAPAERPKVKVDVRSTD